MTVNCQILILMQLMKTSDIDNTGYDVNLPIIENSTSSDIITGPEDLKGDFEILQKLINNETSGILTLNSNYTFC